MGREAKFRKDLSMPGMLAETRRCFEGVRGRGAESGSELGGLPDVGPSVVLAEVSVAAEVREGRAAPKKRTFIAHFYTVKGLMVRTNGRSWQL